MADTLEPIAPQEGRQELAMNIQADLIIFGGAAGCVDKDTQFFSQEGWKNISDYQEGDKVLQYDRDTDTASLVTPEDYIKIPCEELTRFTAKGVDQCLSDEHTVFFWDGYKNTDLKSIPFHEVKRRHLKSKTKGWTGKFKTTFHYSGEGVPLTEGDLRLQVAVMADGRVVKEGSNNYTQMRFSKTRKYERLIELCEKYNLPYKDNGCKYSDQYLNNKAYEVIVWPKYSDKRFTTKYYNCTEDQFNIIIDEVGHWDGSLVDRQNVTTTRYFTKYKEDADFIQFAAHVCGYNTSLVRDNREGKESYTVNITKTGNGYRGIANKDGKIPFDTYKTLDGYKYCFTVSTGAFIIRRNGKICITGNSGKSRLMLMRPLKHVHDPDFTGVIFRRTQEALKKGGSVWPESKKLYRRFNTRVNQSQRTHTFDSGAVLAFDGLKDVGDEERNYQGSQYSFIGFDEGTHFEECQVIYMVSRLRSDAENDAYCMVTCNPDPDSWLLKWVEPYLDDDGFPIREKGGQIRYFLTVDNTPVLSDTEEWLIENYPDQCFSEDDLGNKTKIISSYTFIDGNIYDNPALLRNEPKYLAKLKGQSRVNQQRLLHGNWYAREEASGYWKREWCKDKKPPLNCKVARAYDKAGSEPSEVYQYPDYTASIKLCKDNDGFYYIQASFHPDFKDEGSSILGKFRKRAGERDNLIIKQATQDGTDVTVVLAVDPGSAGKTEYTASAKSLVEHGFVVRPDPMPNNKSKLTRFSPFASACENGLVYIDESSFPNKETLEAFKKELEAFDGERSTSARKDDWGDAVASAFNYLSAKRVIKPFTLPPSGGEPTRYNDVMNSTAPSFGDKIKAGGLLG